MPLSVGTRLGPYEVTGPIGRGGMGEVYRAIDTNLKRQVAIKALPAAMSSDVEHLARFQREAEVLAALNHPNIAQIYGLERAEASAGPGQPSLVLVMELVEGPTLADRVAQGPISVDESLLIARQIAGALESAHEQGIVHRDLKPANVKVRPDGTVKVLDFGLARSVEPVAAASSVSLSPTIASPTMTQPGMILGTAAYMSPEQAKGRSVDKRTDVWAYGCVLYEMLTGRRAFESEDVSETLAAILMKEPDWTALPAGTPPSVIAVLKRCLTKDRQERVRDIGDAALALSGAFEAVGRAPDQTTLQLWQRPLPAALGVLAVAAVSALAAAFLVGGKASPPEVKRLTIVPPAAVPLTSSLDRNLAISPDGTRVVYTTANASLVVRPLDRFADTPLRIDQGAGFGGPRGDERFDGFDAPFVSADGRWVGTVNFLTGQAIRKVPIDGGVPVPIARTADRVRGASWGADNQIVYGSSNRGLFRVSGDGGEPAPLTKLDAANGETSHRWPSIIAGRNAVLFTVTNNPTLEGNQLAVLDLESKVVTRLGLAGVGPRYLSTGHLVYAVSNGSLRAVPFDRQSLRVTGNAVPLVQGVGLRRTGAANFDISENGTLVYAPGGVGDAPRSLALVDGEGRREPLNVPPDAYLSPRLSSDGRQLAVQTITEGGDGLVWLYDLSGRNQIRQFTLKGDNERPIWTPDNQRITFASNRDGSPSLYWQPSDGHAEAERLTTAKGEAHFPGSWSPDGRVLAYMVRRPVNSWSIWTLSRTPGGWKSEPLLEEKNRNFLAPEFSSDGKWLAYAAGDTLGNQDVYVEPFPRTGQVVRITTSGGFWPFWSRQMDRLFYRAISTASGNRLRSVDIITRPAFTFSNESLLKASDFNVVTYYRDYDITSDGKTMVMVFPVEREEGGGVVNVVLNWAEELRRLVPTK